MLVDEAVAIAGQGLQGDRYADGNGTFASGRPGSALTLVDAAVLDSLDRQVDHRRNVVMRGTDLNALVGPRVHARRDPLPRPPPVRAVRPPRSPQRRWRPTTARAPGGLRADIIQDGTIRVGDRLTPD